MKKGTKALIICLVVAAVVAGGAAYTFRPLTFEQAVGGIKTENIERIELLTGPPALSAKRLSRRTLKKYTEKLRR